MMSRVASTFTAAVVCAAITGATAQGLQQGQFFNITIGFNERGNCTVFNDTAGRECITNIVGGTPASTDPAGHCVWFHRRPRRSFRRSPLITTVGD